MTDTALATRLVASVIVKYRDAFQHHVQGAEWFASADVPTRTMPLALSPGHTVHSHRVTQKLQLRQQCEWAGQATRPSAIYAGNIRPLRARA